MKSDYRRYAPIGLGISGLALLTVIGVLILFVFPENAQFTPPEPDQLNVILGIAVAVFILGLAIAILFDPDRARKLITGRQIKYGSNALVSFIAFTAILVVINLAVNKYLPESLDATEDKQHTLAPETLQALNTLPEPVFATAFYSGRVSAGNAEELMQDYKANSAGNFDFQFINPDFNPVMAKELGITGDGKILLQMGEAQEIVTFASERELTSGLVRLLNPDQPSIYFITGEGEHDIDSPGETSYTRVRGVLENKNYIVNSLYLQAENEIPEDARAIVIAGPIVPLSKSSLELIKEYMENGGSLLVLENPVPLTEFEDKTDYLAEYLESDWGIILNNDIVFDPNPSASPFFASSYEYGLHPITEKMQGIAAIFPLARSISIDPESPVAPTGLVYTLNTSWGETDFSVLEEQQPEFDASEDLAGPIILAAAAENVSTEGRVVVFGSSSFALDDNFDFSGNGDMFVNAIDWASEQESIIGITERDTTTRTFVPPGSFQYILTLLTSICIIPLAIIAAGFYAWIMRRQRG